MHPGAEGRAHIVGGNLAGIIARRAKGGTSVPFRIINRQPFGLLPHLQGGITQQVAVQICSFGIFRHNAAEIGSRPTSGLKPGKSCAIST